MADDDIKITYPMASMTGPASIGVGYTSHTDHVRALESEIATLTSRVKEAEACLDYLRACSEHRCPHRQRTQTY